MENNFQDKETTENFGETSDEILVNGNTDSSFKLDDNETHPGDFFLEESAESAYLDGQFSFYDNEIDLSTTNYSYSNDRNKNSVDYQLQDDKYLENLRHGSSLFSLGSSYPQNKNIRSTTGWNNYYSSLQQERNHTVDLSTPTELTPSISAVTKNENQFNPFFYTGSTTSTTISNRTSLSVSPLEARNSTEYDSRNYITFDDSSSSKPPKDTFKFDHIDEMIKPNAKRAISAEFIKSTLEDDYPFPDNITITTSNQPNSISRQPNSTDDRDRNYEDTNTHNKLDLSYLHPSHIDLDYTLPSPQERFTLSDLNNFGESEYTLADHKSLTSNIQFQHQGRYDPKPYSNNNYQSQLDIDNNIFNEHQPLFINDYTGAVNHGGSSSKIYYHQDNRQGGYSQAQAQAQENMNNQYLSQSQSNYGGNYSVKLGNPHHHNQQQQYQQQHQQQQQQQQHQQQQNKHRPPAPPAHTPPGGYSSNPNHRGFSRSTSPPSHHPSASPDLPLQFAQLDRQREVNRRRTPPLTTSYQHQQQHQQPLPSTNYHSSPGVGSTSSNASNSNPPSRGHTPVARPISPQINTFTNDDRMSSPQHFSEYTHPLPNKTGNKIQPAPGEAQAMSNMMLEDIVVNGCYDILKEAAKHSLKAVELANTLRARVGTEILAVVRERWGGLLSLLDVHSELFFVERIPKNDCVTLITGSGPIQSVSGQCIANAAMRPRTQNPKATGGTLSPGIPHYPGPGGSSDRGRLPPSRGNTPPMGGSSTGNPPYYNPSPPLPSPPQPLHHQHQPPQQQHRDSPISCCLHIISIPGDITEIQLRREFEQYGPLECLNVVSLRDRRFATITYYQVEHAINAKNKLSRFFPWKNMITFAKKVSVTSGDPIHAYHMDPSNASYGYTVESPSQTSPISFQLSQAPRQQFNDRTSMSGSSLSRDGYPYDKGYNSLLLPSLPMSNDQNYNDQLNRFNIDDFDVTSHQLGGGVGVGGGGGGGVYDYNSNGSSRTSSIVSPPPGVGEGGAYVDSDSFSSVLSGSGSGQYEGGGHGIRGGVFGAGGTMLHATHSDFPLPLPFSSIYPPSEFTPQFSQPPRLSQQHTRNPSGEYHHFNLNDPTVAQPAFLVDPIGINPTDFDASVLQRLCDDTYVPTQVWQADVEKDAPFCQAILAQLQQLGGTATVSKLRGTLRHRIAAQNNIKSVALKAMLGAYPQFFMVNGNQISVVYSLSGGAGRDMMEPL